MNPKLFPRVLTIVSVMAVLLVGTWLSIKPRVIAGEAAGASIPDHVHVHCLPRWKGDTTFLTSVAEARMIPD